MYATFTHKITYIGILVFTYIALPARSVFAVIPAQEPTTETTTPPAVTMLENPLAGNIDSIPALVKSLLNIVLIIGTPLVALAIIFAGFMLVAAQGNPEKLQKARQALLWAIVGGAVLLGAYVIAQAIGGTVEQLTS